MEQREKKVELIELFYDLIYVYALSNMTALINGRLGNDIQKDFIRYVILFFVIIQAWLYLSNYVNRYGSWTWYEYGLTAVNMIAAMYMANTISSEWEITTRTFNLAMTVLLSTVALLYLIRLLERKQDPGAARNSLQILAVVILLYFSAYIAARFHNPPLAFGLDVIAAFAGAFLPFFHHGHFSPEIVDFPHLTERLELITIITFGEGIVRMTDYFDVNRVTAEAILVFLLTLSLFGCYVLQIHHLVDHTKNRRGFALILSHYFILFALDLIIVTLCYVRETAADRFFTSVMLWGSMAVFFAALFFNHVYYPKEYSLPPREKLGIFLWILLAGGGIFLFRMNRNFLLASAFVLAAGLFVFLLQKYRNGMRQPGQDTTAN